MINKYYIDNVTLQSKFSIVFLNTVKLNNTVHHIFHRWVSSKLNIIKNLESFLSSSLKTLSTSLQFLFKYVCFYLHLSIYFRTSLYQRCAGIVKGGGSPVQEDERLTAISDSSFDPLSFYIQVRRKISVFFKEFFVLKNNNKLFLSCGCKLLLRKD